MIADQQAPIVLEAITLRGIGSYISGARLDIKPLTVICGANGSGKSTWLKALNVLARSLVHKRLPFGFAVADWDPDNIQLTNAFFHLTEPDSWERFTSADELARFGPPGTIGLEMRCVRDHWQSADRVVRHETTPGDFFWSGHCRAGTRFRLRFAHPTYWDDSYPTPESIHLVELVVDERYTIRMEGERDPLQTFEERFASPRRSKPYTLLISPAFLPGMDPDNVGLTPIAVVNDLNSLRFERLDEQVDYEQIRSILDLFPNRTCQLVEDVVDGYFFIGAVRKQHTDLVAFTGSDTDRSHILSRRHVGGAGEHAWLLESRFSGSVMRDPGSTSFTAEDINVSRCVHALGQQQRANDPRLTHIWEHLDPVNRQQLETLATSDSKADSAELGVLLAELLNSALDDPALFNRSHWIEEYEHFNDEGDTIGMSERVIDPEIATFVRCGIDNLSSQDLRRFNLLLILNSLGDYPTGSATTLQCDYYEYLTNWLDRLFDVRVHSTKWIFKKYRVGPWTFSPTESTSNRRPPAPTLLEPVASGTNPAGDITRLNHPCFGSGLLAAVQPPRQLSAGFHQVFPILVQLGLMRIGDLVGIENPEVHLHPSLQVQVAEMLFAHAATGRRIIVETHSDLIIRRVMRAILEEEVAQSQVQVYFTSLNDRAIAKHEQVPIEFQGSALERIQIDEHGRIANWPEGFLDADVRESQRLMEVMYGANEPEEDEEDDESP